MSRGAAHVTFVDRSACCLTAIAASVARLYPAPPPAPPVALHRMDALAAIRRLSRQGRRCDLIFLDPPYRGPWGKISLQGLADHAILAPSGVVVIEYAQRWPVPPAVTGRGVAGSRDIRQFRMARYGETGVAFYQ